MLAAILMSGEVARTARERPLQILVLDGQFKKLTSTLIGEIVNVLGVGSSLATQRR
jgi:hypothetical protein